MAASYVPNLLSELGGDPGADRILFWDDSAGVYTYLTPGAGLTITATTIDAAGGGGGGASTSVANTWTAKQTFDVAPSSPNGVGANASERWGNGAAPTSTGVANTAVGNAAGLDLTTGEHNTLLGYYAGAGLTTGGANAIFGSQISVPADIAQSVVIGRSHVLSGSLFQVVCIGLANYVDFSGTISLGTFAVPTKTNQFVTGRSIDSWTMLGLTSVQGRPACELRREWAVADDATRSGRLRIGAYHLDAFSEAIRVEADAAGPRAGFLGATASARPTVTGSRGGGAALASLLTALATLGLIADGSTA